MCYGVRNSGEPPPPGSPPRALLVALLVSMFAVSSAVVLVTVLAFCCRRRRGDRGAGGSASTERSGPGTARGGDPFPVETLHAFAFDPHQAGGGARECAVCLGAVREGEMVRRLPACMHVYHVECIDRWLAAHRTCPLCRSNLDDPCMVRSDRPVPQVTPDDRPDRDQLSA